MSQAREQGVRRSNAIEGPHLYVFSERRPWKGIRPGIAVSLAALHVIALGVVVFYLWGRHSPEPRAIWLALILYTFTGLSVALGYHRYFTHNGFKTSRAVQAVLLVGGGMSLQGPVSVWVQRHWFHHLRSDRPGDPHSPYQYPGVKGWLWAQWGWLLYRVEIPSRETLPAARQALLGDPLVVMQRRYNWLLVVASFALPFAMAHWDGLLIAGFLRVVLFLNATWLVNSACHVWGQTVAVKYRTAAGHIRIRRSGDGSRNNRWLAVPTLGESYHALHHLFETVAFHAWGRAGIDPTKWTIVFLEACHLVWDVKRPPADAVVEAADLDLPEDSLIHNYRRRRSSRWPV